MNRAKLFFILFVLLSISIEIIGQEKGYGIGAMIGEPTGLSGKYWLDKERALDFGLAYSFVHSNSAISISCDYIYHKFDVIKSDQKLPVYYGFGARLRIVEETKNSIGARGVVGLLWISDKFPVDAFFEIAPVFLLLPQTALQFDFAIGGRYYFNQ